MSALSSAQVSERFAVSMAMKFGGDRLQPTEIRIKAQIDKRPSKTLAHNGFSPDYFPWGPVYFKLMLPIHVPWRRYAESASALGQKRTFKRGSWMSALPR